MKLPSWPFVSAFAVALLSVAELVVAGEINCPATIAEQPTVSGDHKGWTPIARSGERVLEHVGLYLGSLSEHGAQIPDSSKKNKSMEVVTWSLNRMPGDAFWLGCSYTGTTAMMFQELDAHVKSCTAMYDLLPTGKRLRLHSISCQ